MAHEALPFGTWILRHRRHVLAALTTAGMPTTLVGLGHLIKLEWVNASYFPALWFALQAAAVLVLFVLLLRNRVMTDDRRYPGASGEVRRFHTHVVGLFASWIMLYVFLAGRSSMGTPPAPTTVNMQVAVPLAPSTSALSAPVKMSPPGPTATKAEQVAPPSGSQPPSTSTHNAADSSRRVATAGTPLSTVAFWLDSVATALNNLQTAFLILAFGALALPKEKAGNTAIVATLTTLLITIIPPFIQVRYSLGFSLTDVVSGMVAGVTLALFTGRIDSKFLRTPLWPIIALYAYSLLQAVWFLFATNDRMFLVLAGVALALKGVLYLLVSWMISSGLLLYYFQEIRWLNGESMARYRYMVAKHSLDDRLKAFYASLPDAQVTIKRRYLAKAQEHFSAKQFDIGIDVNLSQTDEELFFDIVLEDPDHRLIVLECAHWKGEPAPEDIASFETRLLQARRVSGRQIAAVYVTHDDHQLVTHRLFQEGRHSSSFVCIDPEGDAAIIFPTPRFYDSATYSIDALSGILPGPGSQNPN